MVAKKILIVEDDQDIRELYSEVLRNADFDVIEATDGETGRQRALAGDYDLLLLDIMLPKIDGLEILKAVKSTDAVKDKPIVLLTNLGSESIIKEGFALGADGYLIKSEYDPGQVVNEVTRFLEEN